jgi:hypothetical protein
MQGLARLIMPLSLTSFLVYRSIFLPENDFMVKMTNKQLTALGCEYNCYRRTKGTQQIFPAGHMEAKQLGSGMATDFEPEVMDAPQFIFTAWSLGVFYVATMCVEVSTLSLLKVATIWSMSLVGWLRTALQAAVIGNISWFGDTHTLTWKCSIICGSPSLPSS